MTLSLIALATSIGLTALAEGVETDAQRRILRSLGCTTMQGHLFGKPEPVADFTDVLRTQESSWPSP